MHAIRQHEFGPAANLLYEEVADPVPSEGEVRIAVEAAGVHLIDTAIRRGEAWGYPVPELPMVPGREVAGIVDDVGPGVSSDWHGRRVVAHLGFASGGYAERAVAAVDSLHEIPEHVAADAAVAAIGTGRTAIAILEIAALRSADVVLITAAAGGLGTLFVQAALAAGARVAGVAGGAEKVARVRALGAIGVDYLQPDWPERVREALGDLEPSVVLDGVGAEVGREALGLLGPGGRIILFGWSAGEPTQITTKDLMGRGLTATWALGQRPSRERQRELETQALAAVAEGRLTPVTQRFPLARAAAAHTAVESRATIGKTVLVP
ncbi:MAG TPA: zinc-binding dehydrogenase [Thermoleophilaceae bacterium]|nr:zinc-binding dehydrogenase [Thermoleophilaceae bacterium]